MRVHSKFVKRVGLTSTILNYLLLCALVLAPFAYDYAKKREIEEARKLNEIEWLAKALYFEARGEVKHAGLEGMKVVADVVLTRVGDPRWPKTVEAVVRQGEERLNRCQFSFMCDGEPEYIEDLASWETAKYVAEVAYKKYYSGQTQTCAHSYHANYVKRERFPYFMKLAPEQEIGQHIFYCD